MAITFLVLVLLVISAAVKLVFFPSGKNPVRAVPLPRFFVQENGGKFHVYDRQSMDSSGHISSVGSAHDSEEEANDYLNMMYISESKY